MRDYGVSVLEQYELEVYSARRIRGAVLCDTNRGPLLLKEACAAGGRLPALVRLYERLGEEFPLVDAPLANKEGEYVSLAEDGTCYMVKRWFAGRECDVRREAELLEGSRRLAELHRVMRLPAPEGEDGTWEREALSQEYRRHNRELRKVRSFVAKRSVKGEFETTFLQSFAEMYRLASLAADRLEEAELSELYEEAAAGQTWIHGDYNYHNLLFCPQGLAVTGFERAHREIQMADFYYFLRKTMEKHHYDERLGYRMLRAYDGELALSRKKREYLAIRLAYPEKFWKTANLYYHSNKAWIPGKSVEKLRAAIRQEAEKKRFLENLFAFHL